MSSPRPLDDARSANSDGHGCSDGREVASVNGDQSVTAADLGLVASKFGACP